MKWDAALQDGNDLEESDGISYPWLLVQHRESTVLGNATFSWESLRPMESRNRDKSSTDIVSDDPSLGIQAYHQAANAASAAVVMLRNLGKHSILRDEMPPIITMTTAGPAVRIWITHFDNDFKVYVSVPWGFCIKQ